MEIVCLLLLLILILWIIGSLYKLGISLLSVILQMIKIVVFITIVYCLLIV